MITSDDGDVAIVVGQVVGGKLTSKRAQQNAETIIAAPRNQQRIAELEAALRTVIADFDAIERGNVEPQAAPLLAKDAGEYARAVLNRKEGE